MAATVYSVGQLNKYIRNMFTQDFFLNALSVRGEVSNLKYHSTGHIYFTLKDESGTVNCVMFAGNRNSGLAFRLEEGMDIIVTGNVDVYERTGAYQVYAKKIALAGNGALNERFEQLKKKLEEMGMFDASYKQPIPRYIKRLGVVTAPTGAAVQDIIRITHRRNPYVEIVLYPALVQGSGAAASIVKGIRLLDQAGVDVILVGRGGGSLEDLWAFNEEIVAQAVFDCSTPVISCVGHETDFTICDFVADLRASTPSAGAELAVYDYERFVSDLEAFRATLESKMRERLRSSSMRLNEKRLRLDALSPVNVLNQKKMRLMHLEEKIKTDMDQALSKERNRLLLDAGRMKGLSPLEKLSKGYSYTEDASGKALKSIAQVKAGEELLIHVTDGRIRAVVQETDAGINARQLDTEAIRLKGRGDRYGKSE